MKKVSKGEKNIKPKDLILNQNVKTSNRPSKFERTPGIQDIWVLTGRTHTHTNKWLKWKIHVQETRIRWNPPRHGIYTKPVWSKNNIMWNNRQNIQFDSTQCSTPRENAGASLKEKASRRDQGYGPSSEFNAVTDIKYCYSFPIDTV